MIHFFLPFFHFSFFTIILIPKNTINIPTKIFNIFEIFSGIKLDSIVPDIAIKVKKIIVDSGYIYPIA